MNNIWFTSDTHFHHLACATTHRGFASIEEHNEVLIENWNLLVKNGDSVYHLGDFSFSNAQAVLSLIDRLNGNIYLIRGNHDRVTDNAKVKEKFIWIKDYYEFSTKKFGRPVILSHYCFRVWNRSHYGAYHFHGHSHGSLEADPNSLAIDVGVDCWGYKPVEFDRLDTQLLKREWKPVDHHNLQ